MVNRDTNGWCQLLGDSSSLKTKTSKDYKQISHKEMETKKKDRQKYLELFKSETFTGSDLHVVLESLTMHNRAKRSSSGTGEDLHSLLLSR